MLGLIFYDKFRKLFRNPLQGLIIYFVSKSFEQPVELLCTCATKILERILEIYEFVVDVIQGSGINLRQINAIHIFFCHGRSSK